MSDPNADPRRRDRDPGLDVGPPQRWTRILRSVLRGEEGARVEETLADLYEIRRDAAPARADAWYRRQVLGFLIRLPMLSRRGSWFALPRWPIADSLRQDVGFAFRQIRARPLFALLAILTTGLGIGASTAIFSVVRTVVLEPLPFPDPDRLVAVLEISPSGDDFTTSEANFIDFRGRNQTMEALAAWQVAPVAARLGAETVELEAIRASASFFPVFRGTPILGRTFRDAETDASPEPVAVLSHRVWRGAFGADSAILGRSLWVDGVAHPIVGVMPQAWEPLAPTDLWLPQRLRPTLSRDDHMLSMVGRLSDGQTAATAQADLMRIQRELGVRFPQSNAEWGVAVRPLKTSVVGEDTIRAGWMLLGAVGLLLILSCASVSNLLIARATERQREMSIRSALGATPRRITRQVGTESLVLSAAGGLVGLALAHWVLPLMQSLAPADTPRIDAVRIDLAVLIFSAAAALIVGVLFGTAPALHTLRTDVRGALASGARGSSGGGARIRGALVVVQIAVAFTLLAGVGLLGTTFLRLQAQDPGLDVEQVLAVPLTLPWERFDDVGRHRVLREIGREVGGLPGVAAVGAVNVRPFSGGGTVNQLSIEGMTFAAGQFPVARWRSVTVGYLDAAGVAILAGRGFRGGDRGVGGGEQAVAVVTATMAREIWGSPGAALGRRFAMSANSQNWMRIVGVTEDVRDMGLEQEPAPQFFFPDGGWWPWMTLVVQTEQNAAGVASAIRTAVQSVDGDLPVPVVEPLSDGIRRATAGPRFNFALMLAFGGIALVLALMGVYGVTHSAASRRTREIGIRMALGASAPRAVWLLLGSSTKLAVAGIIIGLALAAAGAKLFGSLLIRTDPLDPLILGAAAALMLATSLGAAVVPASRALRVDTTSVLRAD